MPTALDPERPFRLSETEARSLVKSFGTPLYVISEAHVRSRVSQYRLALSNSWPKTQLSYASKANSTLALIALVASEGCGIDVASEGELRAALLAGVPAARCHMHGNNKSASELRFALEVGIGHIIVDNFPELQTLINLGAKCPIVLRLAPGVDPITHRKISTGQQDTKFGFNIADGSAERAVLICRDAGLDLFGYHCHIGSQLLDPEAQRAGGEQNAAFAVEMHDRYGVGCRYLNVGGGLGIRYTDADHPSQIDDYCNLIAEHVEASLADSGLHPILAHEPGRSLVGEAGVTLYTVGVVKPVQIPGGTRNYVVVDGGLADNPRPALYESKYTVERIAQNESWTYVTDGPGALVHESATITARVSGRHCETDLLFDDVLVAADTAPGDILQVLCTGAYNASMASNYNRYRRPRAVLIDLEGVPSVIQEPESWESMFERESIPSHLRGGDF